MGIIVLVSVWRCYYLPVVTRDAIVGMDLVAKYAVKEGTLHSSVFSNEHLRPYLSNQPYYAPAAAILQAIYRLAGLAFGKIWLSLLFISFVLFLWSKLRETLHPALVGFFMIALMSAHEVYYQTYDVFTDFINAIFFALSVFYLHEHFKNRTRFKLVLSSLLMGMACWCRSETILFAIAGAILVFPVAYRFDLRKAGREVILFLSIPVVAFGLWHLLYVPIVLEGRPEGQIIWSFAPAGQFLSALWETVRLSFHARFGFIVPLFGGSLLLDGLLYRRRDLLDLLGWILVLYVGFALIVCYVPAAYMESTVKRGLLKALFVMVYALSQMHLYSTLSTKIEAWEQRKGLRTKEQDA
jgi:hypothetical protein